MHLEIEYAHFADRLSLRILILGFNTSSRIKDFGSASMRQHFILYASFRFSSLFDSPSQRSVIVEAIFSSSA
jgi:hypothetical protein